MMNPRRTLRSRKFAEQRRKRRTNRALMLLLLIFLALLGSIILFRLDTFTITSIAIKNHSTVPDSDIRRILDNTLAASSLVVFPNRNIFVFPEMSVGQHIVDIFPGVERVVSTISFAGELSLVVEPREQYALWCGEELQSRHHEETGGCFFVDRKGIVFSHAPSFSGNALFVYYGPLTRPIFLNGVSGSPGIFADTERLRAWDELRVALEILNLPAIALIVREESLEVISRDDMRILFTASETFSIALERLRRFMESPLAHDETGARILFSSIDLRFGNKVYYKVKE